MVTIIAILLPLFAGYLLGRDPRLREFGPDFLVKLIIGLFLPATILAHVPGMLAGKSLAIALVPALMPWFGFGFAWVLVRGLSLKLKWESKTQSALILLIGLGNTSFLGFPLIEAWIGAEALPTAVVIDQLGTFLIFACVAPVLGRSSTSLPRWRTLLQFPPLVALVLALVLALIPSYSSIHEILKPMWIKLGSPLTPLAVVVIGLRLDFGWKLFREFKTELIVMLFAKLFLFPFLVWKASAQFDAQTRLVVVAEAAMAPMFSSMILAQKFDLNPRLVSLGIAVGVLISLVTVPVWIQLVK